MATKKTAKTAKKVSHKPLHEKLLKLFRRPNGATLEDTVEAGYKYPALFALRIAERRGYKVKVIKKDGELTRYVATGSPAA